MQSILSRFHHASGFTKALGRLPVLAGLAAAIGVAGFAGAQPVAPYPNKPIRFLVPQAAGGSTDNLSRLIGMRLADALGQPVVIDNRPAANGIVGTEVVMKSPPDGYMLLAGTAGSMAVNPSLYKSLPYDTLKHFDAVVNIGYSTSVLIVHPSVPVKNIAELIAYAKARPGEVRYASAGSGSSPHLSAELFKYMTGLDILHVPYKGSTPGVTATLAGETQMMFTGISSAIGHIRAGTLRALSVNGMRRSAALPDVPTAMESGLPGFEVDFWIGIFTPAGTPRPIITRINTEVNRILTQPDVKERLTTLGIDPAGGTPEQFVATIRKDLDRWAQTVKASKMRVE